MLMNMKIICGGELSNVTQEESFNSPCGMWLFNAR